LQVFAARQGAKMTAAYTPRQGQFLAFIYYYTRVNGRPPAERDMERYFKTSPPAVHQMILTLEKRGFIERTPGQGRSIRLLLPREALPDLEPGGGG
jgi:repressor LexA